MSNASRSEFLLDPGIAMLNHASYGVPTRRTLVEAEKLRRRIEADPIVHLGGELMARLRAETEALAGALSLDPAVTTLCANATAGAAAIIESIRLPAGATVVVFSTEYSSIIRAWERRCARSDARLLSVPVPSPLRSAEELIGRLDETVPGEIAYLQMSVVTSSTALRLPVAEVSAWTRGRGGIVVLDAAHGAGHVPLRPDAWAVDVMFGTVHKWYPTLRPVGLLWLRGPLAGEVRPAEVSLTWDADDLVERFSWPGTYDPVPRLGVRSALRQWDAWSEAGKLDDCAWLADHASGRLVEVGAIPTAAPGFTPPRLRAFILPGLAATKVKAALLDAGIRAWVGQGTDGECLLRISTHVYNEVSDIDALVHEVRGLFKARC